MTRTQLIGFALVFAGLLCWGIAGTAVWAFATDRASAAALALSAVAGPLGELLLVAGLATLGVKALQGRLERIKGWFRRRRS